MKDIFIIHHSVFHDAFRNDYDTQFRTSSKEFLQILFRHNLDKGYKVGFSSGEVFFHLKGSPLGKTKSIWLIPENLVEIDYRTYLDGSKKLKVEQSIIRLASKKCIATTPAIVATKDKEKIDKENTLFKILTPKEAIEYYNHQNTYF